MSRPNYGRVIVSLMECQHCGELGENAGEINHRHCGDNATYGQHPAAVVVPVRVVVMPTEYAPHPNKEAQA